MNQVVVDISISAEQYLAHYKQAAKQVIALSRDGRRVRFPSSLLQPYLLHNGIQGSFRICFDGQGRFQQIERL
ncbi:DUF2835 domain-containing protein [Amphritea sp. HPY]|uniref:DUF2835 domain-containing protein n=1 Tax=Amphritea sp. HPY TaxID=3421652 RepID=UPI003D7CE25D